ncbi:MAG: Adaptive-response sensory-kinase SasA [bacterium]|nr:Adaptive-response sensory-kinase SasA [bacterium]
MRLLNRPSAIGIGLTLVWAVGTCLVFIELQRRSIREIERLADAWASRFDVTWVSRPDEDPHLFRTMRREYFEDLARGGQPFQRVFLSWLRPDSRKETLLYPPEWIGDPVEEHVTKDTLRKELRDDFRHPPAPSGYLYFQLDPWQKRATPITFLLAAINVLLLLLMLLYWLARLSSRYQASVSELEKKKQELIRLEQLALAGKLSAGLLHDLKKPVLHIREECREAPSEQVLADVREQSELFLAMLRDSGLEDFARRSTTEPECCDLVDILERSLRLVEYERNDVEVRFEVGQEIPLIWAHPTRLMQVFSNIALNAYQAMRGRGTLHVSVRCDERASERFAVVEIRDNGPGIPPEHAPHVFDPFFTAGKDGSGLGLYISKTIIEDLGGGIALLPGKDSGAGFRITLPERIEGGRRG